MWQLASTEIAPERDLIPSGTFHAYQDWVGRTPCGLRLGLDVRLFPNFAWERRDSTRGTDCPVCSAAVES